MVLRVGVENTRVSEAYNKTRMGSEITPVCMKEKERSGGKRACSEPLRLEFKVVETEVFV